MPETTVYNSKVDTRAAEAGQAIGRGASSALEDKLMHMANIKAEKVRAGHLKTLYPNASNAQLQALAALGPQAEQQFYKGINAIQQAPAQTQQIPGEFNPQVNFGGIQQTPLSSAQNNFNPVNSSQIQPIDYMNALGTIGLRMNPQQRQQFEQLPTPQQDKIVDDVYSKLPPKYQRQMEDFYNNALAKDLSEKKNSQGSQPAIQPQQIIGSSQPGVGPQQQPQLDVGKALAAGIENPRQTFSQQLAREKFESAKEEKIQNSIKKENAPFLKQIESQGEITRKSKEILLRMKDLLESGNVYTGIKGSYVPQRYQNADTQSFVKDGKTLVALLTEQQRGVPTNFKIKFNQDIKPSPELKYETNKNLIKNLLDEVNFVEKRIKVIDQLIDENNGNQPKNLEKSTRKRLVEMEEAPPIPYGAKEGDQGHDEFGQLWVIKNGEMTKGKE